jgi:CBS domain-containing protein
MAKTVGELMTRDPVMLQPNASVKDAARVMRDRDIGAVLVADDGGRLVGMLTDRDIVVRGIADKGDPSSTRLMDIVSKELETVTEKDPVDNAVKKMRSRAIRRIPVVDKAGKPVGMVAIGDLAVDLDSKSALADISASDPNR